MAVFFSYDWFSDKGVLKKAFMNTGKFIDHEVGKPLARLPDTCLIYTGESNPAWVEAEIRAILEDIKTTAIATKNVGDLINLIANQMTFTAVLIGMSGPFRGEMKQFTWKPS